MTPAQRAAAERLIGYSTQFCATNAERECAALLRELLAEPMRCPTDGGLCGAGGYCRELATVSISETVEPQGEPVATLHDDGCFTWKRDEFRHLYDRQRAGWRMDVYAHPPQRQRQPLVMQEINALPEASGWWPCGLNDRIVKLIRAVERKHLIGEKK